MLGRQAAEQALQMQKQVQLLLRLRVRQVTRSQVMFFHQFQHNWGLKLQRLQLRMRLAHHTLSLLNKAHLHAQMMHLLCPVELDLRLLHLRWCLLSSSQRHVKAMHPPLRPC
jgi:hypothetical protein